MNTKKDLYGFALPHNTYHKVTPPMPDEYPFWISAYGESDHQAMPHHEITTNTQITRIQYVLSGKEIINSKNISCVASAGDTYILHTGDMHNYYSDAAHPTRKIWIHVKGKLADDIIKTYHLDDIVLLKNIDTSNWIRKMHELCNNTNDPYIIQEDGAALFVKGISNISREYRKKQANVDFLDDIKSYIDLHVQDNLSIEELSKISNYSTDYTIRHFKKKFGITPHQYILNSKMALATTLLRSSDKSIASISEMLGFCNVGYFSNVFLSYKGIRPSEFRVECKKFSAVHFGYKKQ